MIEEIGGNVASVIEELGEAVVGGVVQETVDELTGRSTRKWAVILLALVVGGAVAAAVIRLRRRRCGEVPGSTGAGTTTATATSWEGQP